MQELRGTRSLAPNLPNRPVQPRGLPRDRGRSTRPQSAVEGRAARAQARRGILDARHRGRSPGLGRYFLIADDESRLELWRNSAKGQALVALVCQPGDDTATSIRVSSDGAGAVVVSSEGITTVDSLTHCTR